MNKHIAKHLEQDKWRINANSVASYKVVEFLEVRRWEKRDISNFYWVMLLAHISSYAMWEYWKIMSQNIIHKDLM